MILVKIEQYDRDFDRLLDIDPKMVVADSIGQALDCTAPDPAEGASFKITVVSKRVEVV